MNKDKISKKIKNKLNQKELEERKKKKKILDNKITRCCQNLNKLKNYSRIMKSSRYYQNYDNFLNDFISIIQTEYITIINITKIIKSLCKYRFFTILTDKYNSDKFNELQTINKEFLDTLDMDAKEDILYEYDKESSKYTLNKMTEYIKNIIKLIYEKFNRLNDKVVLYILDIIYVFDIQILMNYLEQINFKTNNNKIKKYIINNIAHDVFSLLYEINLEDLFLSKYISLSKYDEIDKFIDKYKLHDKIDQIIEILINLMIKKEFYICGNMNENIKNIISWLIKRKELTDIQKNKILGYLLLILTIDAHYDIDLDLDLNREDHHHIDNVELLIKQKYDDIIKKIKFSKKISVKDIFNVSEIILCEFYKYIKNNVKNNYRSSHKNNYDSTKFTIDNYMHIFDVDPDKIFYINYTKLTGNIIKRSMNFIIKNYINNVIDKISPTKNIMDLYKINLFRYENIIYSYDEKIEIFKKIYVGKITTKDIEMFILYHNHLANYAINKISNQTEDIIKIAFYVGNINVIEHLIDTKYPLTSKHLTYLVNCNESNLYKLIECINKYNTINYFENFDWYYHLNNLFPQIDFPQLIFNEDNEELRNKLKEKIKEINDNELNNYTIFKKLDEMDYISFIEYYKSSENKIKLSMNDIIKFKDHKKSNFLLNN
jgi:hypothetical protein